MKVIIDIDEGLYQEIIDNAMFAPKIIPDVKWAITSAMVNGTPLNGTNGEVLKAVFPNVEIMDLHGQYNEDFVGYSLDGDSVFNTTHKSWWNADYKEGSEDV